MARLQSNHLLFGENRSAATIFAQNNLEKEGKVSHDSGEKA
jgi:hypothetical protein